MKDEQAGFENFEILIEGEFKDLNIESLFEEFKSLVSISNTAFGFELGDSEYDEVEEHLDLNMEATISVGRCLRLTTDNNGELCIDALNGAEIEVTARLPHFDNLRKGMAHVVLDFLNEDYGAFYGDWYKD